MEERLQYTVKLLREFLKFPDRTRAQGFDDEIDLDSIVEIDGSDQIRFSAIDGGTAEIIKVPTLAVVLNRVYCNSFIGMRKLDFFDKSTFISITRAVKEGDRIFYETEVTQVLEGKWKFKFPKVDSCATEMKVGRSRGDITRAVSMARRFCEWAYVENALRSGSEFILMDGTLQTAFPGESELANEVHKTAVEQGSLIAGLSKTTTIFTQEGHPISGFLDNLARKRGFSRWVARIGRSEEWTNRAVVYFVKLNEGADRGFRLDVFEDVETDRIKRLLRGLVANSRYFAFPGYPYSLIDAHTYARVGMEEALHVKDLILDMLDVEDIKRLEVVERSLSGHRILDELG
ncbi:MAG: DNA double-strand break repair nuclease NurA [Candidatus Methanomethyliaceae archaeon]|nr:DNA double-strand break repair nuclease NurA [Candidatus Methanomethyliaceae archaeon]